MTETPFSVGSVTLTVHDLDRVSTFYQKVVGLHLLTGDATAATLGVDGNALLELRVDTAARRRSPREAGLFHTAFLLPERIDLGRWVQHAIQSRAPVVGASDHSVSEALYLTDPEGNGVEIYADRPASEWKWKNGVVEMPSDPLDIESLIANASAADWKGFPARSTVGHVHLQVGAIPTAEAFYGGDLGLAITCRYPGGTFYAADGYHHHIATNIWNSRGAAVRSFPSTGLTGVELKMAGNVLQSTANRVSQPVIENRLSLQDPWGTPLTLIAL